MSSEARDAVLRRLVLDDPDAAEAVRAEASASDDPVLLVAAALLTPDGAALLARAAGLAATTRDRQLVVIADAHLRGDAELVDALARDHLVDHPDNVLVAWIAAASHGIHPSPHPSLDRSSDRSSNRSPDLEES